MGVGGRCKCCGSLVANSFEDREVIDVAVGSSEGVLTGPLNDALKGVVSSLKGVLSSCDVPTTSTTTTTTTTKQRLTLQQTLDAALQTHQPTTTTQRADDDDSTTTRRPDKVVDDTTAQRGDDDAAATTTRRADDDDDDMNVLWAGLSNQTTRVLAPAEMSFAGLDKNGIGTARSRPRVSSGSAVLPPGSDSRIDKTRFMSCVAAGTCASTHVLGNPHPEPRIGILEAHEFCWDSTACAELAIDCQPPRTVYIRVIQSC